MKFGKKTLISGIIVTTVLVSCSAAYAAGTHGGMGGNGINQAPTQNSSSSIQKQSSSNAMNQAMTQNSFLGQSRSSDRQNDNASKNKLSDNRNGNAGQGIGKLEKFASYLSIDTTNLKHSEIVSSITTAVKALSSTDLAALAGKLDIDTTGKTNAELVSAIDALLTPPTKDSQSGNCTNAKGAKLVKIASYLSIDTTDLKPSEIVSSITTAVEALSSTDLATLAGKLDIDTTDKTDAELVTAIEALLTPPTHNNCK